MRTTTRALIPVTAWRVMAGARGWLAVSARRLAVFALVMFVVSAAGGPGHAEPGLPSTETILSYDARLQVEPSGGLIVRERIRVAARGEQIKHGIFRDLPLYRNTMLGPARQEFALLGVRRDGADEPYHTERNREGVRIYAGHEDVLLRPNVYTYEFEYRFGAKVASFADFDELYWNVTGNNWAFPIERVTATVILPGGARMIRGTSYTGPAGSKDRDATLSVDGAGNPEFMTTRSLAAGEGLTIALSWPKGFVVEPTPQDKLLPMLLQHPASLAALATVVIVFAYYTIIK